jgi:3-methyladenine DNA glycosylase Tag
MALDMKVLFTDMEQILLESFGNTMYRDGTTVSQTLALFRGWNLDRQTRKYFEIFRKEDIYSSDAPISPEQYDAFYYWASVYLIFYAGMRFETVTKYLPALHKWFGDCAVAAAYSDTDMTQIFSDKSVIRNKSKLSACARNARKFQQIIQQHGSFHAYRATWPPIRIDNKSDYITTATRTATAISDQFHQFGITVALHFLSEICEPVIKPDTHVCRVLYRLGLIDDRDPKDIKGKLLVSYYGCELSNLTGNLTRYIDIVLMRFGYHIGRLRGQALVMAIQRRLSSSSTKQLASLHGHRGAEGGNQLLCGFRRAKYPVQAPDKDPEFPPHAGAAAHGQGVACGGPACHSVFH